MNESIPALHVSSETGGSFTYCNILGRSPLEDVVPQPEAMVSAHPTYDILLISIFLCLLKIVQYLFIWKTCRPNFSWFTIECSRNFQQSNVINICHEVVLWMDENLSYFKSFFICINIIKFPGTTCNFFAIVLTLTDQFITI